jgi:hypothetical protein
MGLIVPYFAQAQSASIVIDGVTYRVPLIDSGGRVYINAKATGAGEVKATRYRSLAPSTTRQTIITPTSGTAVRIVAVSISHTIDTTALDQIYFGLGSSIAADPAKAIMQALLKITIEMNAFMAWPDGAGPVGAVDDVVSLITDVDVTTAVSGVIHYREE